FQAAGLEPSAINIYLVNDKTLNAFVAGGQKLFLNTGLLIRSQNAGQVIGVIAHETGHIAGGHLSRTGDAMKKSSAASILAMVLGGAVAIGGRGDVGSAIIAGGQQMSTRSFLQYSRTQESAADAAAMRFLDATEQSAMGMLEFFEILGDQELLSVKRQDPYYRSHPLTRERENAVEDFVLRSPYTNKPEPADFIERHARMKAKLQAFLNPVSRTLRIYKEDDPRIEARYARAIAYYRRPDLERAIPLIDGLIAERPADPYFQELKGQMLFENGRIGESLPYYEKAVFLAPGSALLHRDLGRVQIETGDPELLEGAIGNFLFAANADKTDPFSWRLLGTAYGKAGKRGESSLALGEAALLMHKPGDAKFHAERAAGLFEEGSTGWMQAQDILHALDNQKKK
ncbi:MAG: M48 family metallopeptidase, partial [Rhodospirillales bacterium]|nr:M48 family metallopeptidase [Rhodospirillales bacterium]